VARGERRPADDVADGGIVYLEEIGGPGLHPAAADEVVECLNVGTIGYVGHGELLGKKFNYMARAGMTSTYEKLVIRQEHRLGLAYPALFPRRPGELAGAGSEPIEHPLIGREGLEEIEQHVGELTAGREQQAIVAVAHALREARSIIERADRNAGAEQVGDLHRDVEPGRRAMQAQAEVGGADDQRVIIGLEKPGAELNATRRQSGEAALELGPARAVAGDEDHQLRESPRAAARFPSANALLEVRDSFDDEIEILVLGPARRTDDEADGAGADT